MSSITSPVKSDLDPVWEGFHYLKESFSSLTQVQKRLIEVQLLANQQINSLQQEVMEAKHICGRLETKLAVATLQINFLTNTMTAGERLRQWEKNTVATRTDRILRVYDKRLKAMEEDIKRLQVPLPLVHYKLIPCVQKKENWQR